MAKIIYYPLGNADSALITTDTKKRILFDFGATGNSADENDKRIDLPQSVKDDIGWPDNKTIDVLAITHGDNDHIQGISDTFWLKHASKYQGDDRIKFDEMWVPAALIVEEGSKDETRIIRAEARHRFLNKDGIRVFSRPGHLKDWLEKQGKKFEEYEHLITDAGQLVPDLSLDKDGIEFFVHSPFAQRTEDGLLDRNQNCLVMQAVIRSGSCDTKILITADSVASEWEKMVTITRAHKNDHRLEWDVFTIPHHCSYLSMAHEKGDRKTEPTPEFEWLLSQGSKGSIMISKSWIIPSETTDQPPHVETYRRYKETEDALEAELVVTMEHPTKSNPKRLVIEVGFNGPTLKKSIITSGVSAVTTRATRVG